MRVLLDTNIIIHRENKTVSNYSIGHLYRWIDRLKYEKVIHPCSILEIKKYKDPNVLAAFEVKLCSYNVLQTVVEPTEDFVNLIGSPERTPNDKIDNTLLYEVYLGRVDLLITEDRGLREKARRISLGNRVFSINAFISKAASENPSLIEYKMLSVKKTLFGHVDVNDAFFDSFRLAYHGFNAWFMRKCDEEAYICKNDTGNILGFLYIKTENDSENYLDIRPPFEPKRRLKVGTFKVESTGFRLGERFMKIIFDNAIQRNVDEIYITMFTDREELSALFELATRWGFREFGKKVQNGKEETVLVKPMKKYIPELSCRENFPNIRFGCNKFMLPIYPQYHTTLLPDSKLNNENEVDFLGHEPHRYALQKVYISWASTDGVSPGDLFVFYRMGSEGSNKKYSSVLTTVALVEEIVSDVESKNQLLQICQNRSVFSTKDLSDFWDKHHEDLKILKFIFVKSLTKRLPLAYLWDKGIVSPPYGPRPFSKLTDDQFRMILSDSETELNYIDC